MAHRITIKAWGMNDRINNLDLTDEQKTRLFGLGLEPISPANVVDEDELRGDLLCDILRSRLPAQERHSHVSNSGTQGLRAILGPSMGEALQNPKSQVRELTRIKDYAKTLGAKAHSDAERNVLLAVYFAAIAGALTHHDRWITEHTRDNLLQFFTQFAVTAWMPTDLRELFVQAAQYCESEERRQGIPE